MEGKIKYKTNMLTVSGHVRLSIPVAQLLVKISSCKEVLKFRGHSQPLVHSIGSTFDLSCHGNKCAVRSGKDHACTCEVRHLWIFFFFPLCLKERTNNPMVFKHLLYARHEDRFLLYVLCKMGVCKNFYTVNYNLPTKECTKQEIQFGYLLQSKYLCLKKKDIARTLARPVISFQLFSSFSVKGKTILTS